MVMGKLQVIRAVPVPKHDTVKSLVPLKSPQYLKPEAL